MEKSVHFLQKKDLSRSENPTQKTLKTLSSRNDKRFSKKSIIESI